MYLVFMCKNCKGEFSKSTIELVDMGATITFPSGAVWKKDVPNQPLKCPFCDSEDICMAPEEVT